MLPENSKNAIKAIREALAAGPTPGPWFGFFDGVRLEPIVFGHRDVSDYVARVLTTVGRNEDEHRNAIYIAACNPVNIAILLALLDAQEEDLARLDW